MTIYFLRHAEAEDLAESDFDRKLTPKVTASSLPSFSAVP